MNKGVLEMISDLMEKRRFSVCWLKHGVSEKNEDSTEIKHDESGV